MFICDRLYKKAIKFLYMGIKLPKKNSPIVEISAYAPLISSAIVGKAKINPKNILILKDVDRYFDTKVAAYKSMAYGEPTTTRFSAFCISFPLFIFNT